MHYKNVKMLAIIGFLLFALSPVLNAAGDQRIVTPRSRQNLNALREKLPNTIHARGKLEIIPRAKENWLVLHSTDGTMYILTGGMVNKAQEIINNSGDKNAVTVTGHKNGRTHIACDISYKFNEKNQQVKKAKCIHYYELEVYEISRLKTSDIALSPPKRDKKEEQRALQSSLYNRPGLNLTPSLTERVLGQSEGTITGIDTISPFKTIKIETYSQNKPITRRLVITAKTIIIKKVGDEEPMTVTPEALKEGQKVTVVYSRDELKTKALFITITGE